MDYWLVLRGGTFDGFLSENARGVISDSRAPPTFVLGFDAPLHAQGLYRFCVFNTPVLKCMGIYCHACMGVGCWGCIPYVKERLH